MRTHVRQTGVLSGESVNCNIPGESTNDIHVAIGQTLDAPGVHVDHRRDHPALPPARLDDARSFERAERRNVRQSARLDRPLPFTGHPDVRREPPALRERPAGGQCSSARVLMGGPPVYQIDVCTQMSVEQCAARDDGVWMRLDRWASPALR
jgi:hypothetical protein